MNKAVSMRCNTDSFWFMYFL